MRIAIRGGVSLRPRITADSEEFKTVKRIDAQKVIPEAVPGERDGCKEREDTPSDDRTPGRHPGQLTD